MSLWELISLAVGIVIGGLLSALPIRRLQQHVRSTPVETVQPPAAPAVIEVQEALHEQHERQAVEDAQRRADEAKPKGDLDDAVKQLF